MIQVIYSSCCLVSAKCVVKNRTDAHVFFLINKRVGRVYRGLRVTVVENAACIL